MSEPVTAAPSTGGNIPGGIFTDISLITFPKFVEDLELTSLVFSYNIGTGAGDAQVWLEWRDGENEATALAPCPVLVDGTAGRVSFGKHFTGIVGTYGGGSSNLVSASLPVDTLITRNTTLVLRTTCMTDEALASLGTLRYRMRRDRDRTETLGTRKNVATRLQ